jgi:hypothetical protein
MIVNAVGAMHLVQERLQHIFHGSFFDPRKLYLLITHIHDSYLLSESILIDPDGKLITLT